MPYRAGAGSGLFGSYATPPKAPMVDVGGAIDSLTNGASSLIAQAYGIKRAKAEFGLQQQRENREATAQQAELAFKQKEAEDRTTERAQDLDLKQTAERHRFIEAGGIPSKTDTQAVPAGNAPITPFQPSPIASAMGGLPPVRVTPSNAPASTGPGDLVNANPAPAAPAASVPVNTIQQRTTPESYDPTRSGSYQRTVDAATIRQTAETARAQGHDEAAWEREQARLAAQQSMKEFTAGEQERLARLKIASQNAKGAIQKAMTGNQAEASREHTARGLIDRANGSYDQAVAFLNSPDAASIRALGVEPRHLMYAHSQYVKEVSGQASKLQSGLLGRDAAESVAAVDSTRRLVGGASKPAAAGAQPAITPATPGKQPAPVVKPPAKGASAPPAAAAPPADDFSDDEVAAAMKAGKTTPDDVRTYIAAQRKKKKGGA